MKLFLALVFVSAFHVVEAFRNSKVGDANSTGVTHVANGAMKKGTVMPPTSTLQCEDLKMYDHNKLGWWYSWRQAPVKNAWVSDDCKEFLKSSHFVPMLKNQLFLEADQYDATYTNAPYLMGFNEPYGDHSKKPTGVKKMKPADAVEWMKKVIEKAESTNPNMQLIAPVVNPKKSAMVWYKEFHKLAVAAGIWSKFMYMNVHTHKCDAEIMMKKLKKVYEVFGLPIWLTEFNCGGSSAPDTTPAQHLAFMKALLPKLEAAPYIARYAWYSLRNTKLPNANLAKGVGQKKGEGWVNEFTELGQFYNDFAPSGIVAEQDKDENIQAQTDEEMDADADDDDDDASDDNNEVTDWFKWPIG